MARQRKTPKTIKPSGRKFVSPQDAALFISFHPDSHRRLRVGRLRLAYDGREATPSSPDRPLARLAGSV